MKITSLRISNFRSIKSLEVTLDETTVLIGPNNAGKTAILEALRIALSRRWGQRGTGFTEYDVHCPEPGGDPRTLPPVSIQIALEEPEATPWPDDTVAALEEHVTIGPAGKNLITLRIGCAWSPELDAFEPAWDFLNPDGEPLSASRARATNLSSFFGYLPLFWLGALRDAVEEFGPRSPYWGRLLKSVKIPEDVKNEVKAALDELDERLLKADPRLGEIADTVGQATHVAISDAPGAARLRMLPLNTWDLLSRAGVVLRSSDVRPWLPLDHHGQGLQSLSVIFLLQAAVIQMLAEDARPGMEPLFAIEEPEAHLHPQAARTLWNRISSLPGQKIATTHSPYFVQHVPLHNLRIVRLVDGQTEVSAIARRLLAPLAWNDKVAALAAHSASMIERDPKTGRVSSVGWFDSKIADALANCWRDTAEEASAKAVVETFRHECRALVPASDEFDLSVSGRRVRGEVFFARKWILVEGQCEYLLIHAIGESLGWSLDQHGVAVIDFQNNGNPGVYATLAEAFELPWRMIVDGDQEGEKFKGQLLKRGFNAADLAAHVLSMAPTNNLESQLVADGHEALLRSILRDDIELEVGNTPEALQSALKEWKTDVAAMLAKRVVQDKALAAKMPKSLVDTINALKNGTL